MNEFKQVLIVDDDHSYRETLIDLINRQDGFAAKGAHNGKEGFCLLKKDSYDVLITDTNMPYMDGVELLLQCAKHFPQLRKIILFSTSIKYPGLEKDDLLMLGASHVLEKSQIEDLCNPELLLGPFSARN